MPKGLMQSFGIWRHPGFDFYKPCADFDIRVYTFLRVDFIGGIFYDLMLVAFFRIDFTDGILEHFFRLATASHRNSTGASIRATD